MLARPPLFVNISEPEKKGAVKIKQVLDRFSLDIKIILLNNDNNDSKPAFKVDRITFSPWDTFICT